MQFKNNPEQAEVLFKKAIEVDPMSDIAYGPLAQLYMSRNRTMDAVAVYDQAIESCRTEAEIINVICCKEAALAQLGLVDKYPAAMKKLAEQQGPER